MPGHIGFTVASEIYDFIYRGITIDIEADLYMRLMVEPSNRSGGGVETNYGSYGRLIVPRDTSLFAATANGRITNIVTAQFPAPTTLGNGNFVWFDIVDTPSGAINKIYNAGPILPEKIVQIGKPPKFGPGKLVFTL